MVVSLEPAPVVPLIVVVELVVGPLVVVDPVGLVDPLDVEDVVEPLVGVEPIDVVVPLDTVPLDTVGDVGDVTVGEVGEDGDADVDGGVGVEGAGLDEAGGRGDDGGGGVAGDGGAGAAVPELSRRMSEPAVSVWLAGPAAAVPDTPPYAPNPEPTEPPGAKPPLEVPLPKRRSVVAPLPPADPPPPLFATRGGTSVSTGLPLCG
jgi:hypothetical protein